MGFLSGKRVLIAGVASKRSIAWGIAQSMQREGAELAFTYQGDRLKDRVMAMAAECDSDIVLPCNVESDNEINATFDQLSERWDHLDAIIHSIAFAPSDQLEGDYLENITREGFRVALDISAYSFTAMAKAARPMMQGRNASLITLTYLGAVQALPNYNVMGLAKASLEASTRYLANSLGPKGIRVNAISAGPLRTLAAAGIADFRKLLDYVETTAPMRKNITIEQVGDTAAFLASDMSSGITGQIIYVDNGYSIVGMPNPS